MSRNGLNNKGGRPKGSKTKATLEKEKVLKALRQRTMRNANLLYDSQMSIARGVQFLYKIEKEFIKTGTNKKTGEAVGWYKNKKPVLVESETEIRMYIEGLHEEGDADDVNDSGKTYYYITTQLPDNKALDSMLDRTFGKSAQSVDVTTNGKDMPTPILHVLDTHKKNE